MRFLRNPHAWHPHDRGQGADGPQLPPNLQDTAQSGYDQSAALIARWHGTGRQLYAVTPRFAITSTPEQLELAGDLLRRTPGLYMQTHLAENLDEIAAVRSLFPHHSSYLDVYAKAGLDGPRAIFGHAIHMSEHDFAHCHHSGCTLAHCPTSNLFLGSGAFRLFDALKPDRPVHVALGTDIGAGTSLSLLATMGEAYKVSLMAGDTRLSAAQALWLATAGAARACTCMTGSAILLRAWRPTCASWTPMPHRLWPSAAPAPPH